MFRRISCAFILAVDLYDFIGIRLAGIAQRRLYSASPVDGFCRRNVCIPVGQAIAEGIQGS